MEISFHEIEVEKERKISFTKSHLCTFGFERRRPYTDGKEKSRAGDDVREEDQDSV